MSETEATTRAGRNPFLALAQWLLLVAVAFAAVAAGMDFLSGSLDVRSPVVSEIPPIEGPGAAGFPGAPAAGGNSNPDFRLASLDGGQLGPADYPGQVVLVEFWATWCGPCRLQARFLEELYGEYAGQGVRFLAVNVGEELETVQRYVAKSPFSYPVLLDPKDTMTARYQLLGLPTVMIVDRQGNISFLNTGVSTADQLRRELDAAGAGGATA